MYNIVMAQFSSENNVSNSVGFYSSLVLLTTDYYKVLDTGNTDITISNNHTYAISPLKDVTQNRRHFTLSSYLYVM